MLDADSSMPTYQVYSTEPSEMEVDAIYLNMMRFGPDAADRWHEGFLTSLETLAIMPRAFPIAKESDKMGGNIRVMLYGKGRNIYRILYMIVEPEGEEPGIVNVLHVRHAARRPYGEDED